MIKISRVYFLDVSPPERLIGLGKPHIARLANITAGLAVPVAVVSHQLLCHPATDLTTTGVPRQRPGLVPEVYSKAHFAARPRTGLLRRRPWLAGARPVRAGLNVAYGEPFVFFGLHVVPLSALT